MWLFVSLTVNGVRVTREKWTLFDLRKTLSDLMAYRFFADQFFFLMVYRETLHAPFEWSDFLQKKNQTYKNTEFLYNDNSKCRTNDSGSWTSLSGTPPTYMVLPKLNFLVKFNFSCGIESITKFIVLFSLTNWIYKNTTSVNTFN